MGGQARPADATLVAPGHIVRAWGHPVGVRGDVTFDGNRANLRALDIPPGQFVELRTLIPRRVFTSTAGMKVESGPGLEKIVAEERADAASYERDQRKIDEALDNLPRTLALLLLLALGPALGVVAVVWWFYGREHGTSLRPGVRTGAAYGDPGGARAGSPRPGRHAGSLEFTATLFDLIRRGRYRAEPVTTERKTGAG